jgi:Protein of unknown function (DUF2917)
MNTTDLFAASINLRKGAIHRLPNGHGQRIESLSGSLWITIDNDRRDILVNPGDGFDIDREGAALISALDDARFVVLRAG